MNQFSSGFTISCNFLTDRRAEFTFKRVSHQARWRPLSKCLSTCVLHDETSPLMIRDNKSRMLSLGVQRSRRPKQLRFVVKSWRYCILMTRHKDSMFLTVELPGDAQILRWVTSRASNHCKTVTLNINQYQTKTTLFKLASLLLTFWCICTSSKICYGFLFNFKQNLTQKASSDFCSPKK